MALRGKEMTFKCGFVAIVGRPNAGKSTLLNRVLGNKLAITSAKPQTTRHRIVGIHNESNSQMILVDTPGIHEAWTALNQSMVQRSMDAISESDVTCWILDASVQARRVEQEKPLWDAQELDIQEALNRQDGPTIVVLNKVDIVPKPLLLPIIEAIAAISSRFEIVPISALTGDSVDAWLSVCEQYLPEHPPLYPIDEWAQVTERFLASEIIREKIFHLTEQEVPYSSCVEIEQFDEKDRKKKKLVRIHAKIIVERGSQKGIIIGKGGEMLKRIGTMARQDIQEILGCRVYLELFVKVEANWTKTKKGLRKVGYDT